MVLTPGADPVSQKILREHAGDVSELKRLGITEYAIVTYLVRVRGGQSRASALEALLQGRPALKKNQREFVGRIVAGLPVA